MVNNLLMEINWQIHWLMEIEMGSRWQTEKDLRLDLS